MDAKSDDMGTFAYGLLACIAAICVTYLILRVWPRQHYPRFFAAMAGIAAVASMYVYQIPGAGFALGALCVLFYLSMMAPDAIGALFEPHSDKVVPSKSQPITAASHSRHIGLGHLALGVLMGFVVSLSAVSAVVMPPSNMRDWIMHRDSLHERVARAINPNKEWSDLVVRERDARQAQSKLQAENAALTKRATDAEVALSKAQDELGTTTSQIVRGIVVKAGTGSRHANGLVYIGVKFSVSSPPGCYSVGSSDKVDAVEKRLQPGEAIKLASSKGGYRIVLIGIAEQSCTFDLVKE